MRLIAITIPELIFLLLIAACFLTIGSVLVNLWSKWWRQ